MNKRIRIFAGPNGSGKSTIINRIREYKVSEERPLDFGIYINADDIAVKLRDDCCNFSDYNISFDPREFKQIIQASGLLNDDFSLQQFEKWVTISEHSIAINHKAVSAADKAEERIAQIFADYLRVKLLNSEQKFSFETVFSHKGKVTFIKKLQKQAIRFIFIL